MNDCCRSCFKSWRHLRPRHCERRPHQNRRQHSTSPLTSAPSNHNIRQHGNHDNSLTWRQSHHRDARRLNSGCNRRKSWRHTSRSISETSFVAMTQKKCQSVADDVISWVAQLSSEYGTKLSRFVYRGGERDSVAVVRQSMLIYSHFQVLDVQVTLAARFLNLSLMSMNFLWALPGVGRSVKAEVLFVIAWRHARHWVAATGAVVSLHDESRNDQVMALAQTAACVLSSKIDALWTGVDGKHPQSPPLIAQLLHVIVWRHSPLI